MTQPPSVASAPVPGPARAAVSTVLRPLCLIYTLALFVVTLAEGASGGRIIFHGPAALIYFALLAAYAGEKELRGWAAPTVEEEPRGRKGEYFVAAWALLALAAYLASNLSSAYVFPHDLLQITLEVTGIFFGTRASKVWRQSRRTRREQDADLEERLLAAARGAGGVTTSSATTQLGISRSTAQRLLRKLSREGLLVRQSAGPRDPDTTYTAA